MKCMHCNVELGAQHRVCPLCGEKAVSAPVRVAGQTAEYPFLAKEKPSRRKKEKTASFPLEKE